MGYPDIYNYYQRPGLAVREESAWRDVKFYERHAREVLEAVTFCGGTRVVELCCGSGWVPTRLPDWIDYTGVDRTPQFLEWARAKNAQRPNTTFLLADIREVEPPPCDVVAMFAALKHFGLHEWEEIVARALSLAPHGVLEMQTSTQDFDSGTEFHHVFVTQERLANAILNAGHDIILQTTSQTWTDVHGPAVEVTCHTKRR